MPSGNEKTMAEFKTKVATAWAEGLLSKLVEMGKITEADRIEFMRWFVARPR